MTRLATLLSGSDSLRKYTTNISWLLVENFVRYGLALGVGVYTARYLSPNDYGVLNYVTSYVALFSAFASLGIDSIVVRDLVRDFERRDEILGTAFMLKLSAATLMVLLIIGTLLFSEKDTQVKTYILIIAAGEFFRSFEVVNCYYQAKVLSKKVVRIQLYMLVGSSVLKLLLIFLQAALVWFVVLTLVGIVAGAIGNIMIYRRDHHKLRKWRFSVPLAKRLLNDSWPLTLNTVAMHAHARIDQIMLGDMVGTFELGQYAVALRMIEVFNFVPVIVQRSFDPAIVSAKVQSEGLYHQRLLGMYRLMFLLFLGVAIPAFFLSEWGVVLLFGEAYRPAGVLLSLLAIRQLFTNMGVAKGAFIVNEDLFRFSLFSTVVGVVFNLAANYLLIPRYAAIGALVATIISYTVSIFLVDFLFSKTRQNVKRALWGMLTFWRVGQVLKDKMGGRL